jgi:uncharacterized membrane protein (GlpM family)
MDRKMKSSRHYKCLWWATIIGYFVVLCAVFVFNVPRMMLSLAFTANMAIFLCWGALHSALLAAICMLEEKKYKAFGAEQGI